MWSASVSATTYRPVMNQIKVKTKMYAGLVSLAHYIFVLESASCAPVS